MKMRWVAAAVMGLTLSTTAFAASPPTTDADKLSYSIGSDLGKNFKQQSIPINPEWLLKGMQDSMNGTTLLLTPEQMKEVLNKFQKEVMAKRLTELNKKAQENKAAGEAFLQKNKLNKDVVTLPSGLQYKIITPGNGAKPTKDDTVSVDYVGRLLNGEEFDSSKKTGKPATFKLSQVIPGWIEALQLMPVGSTWEVYVPSDLAYGQRGVGGPIGPNETLIFSIHLLSINK